MKSSIVITNYNGLGYLKKCLPTVRDAIEYAGGDHQCIIVDDCSSDESVAYIRKNFPEFELRIPQQNLGFQKASNFGVKHAKHDIVIMLNNDIMLEKDNIVKLTAHFHDDSVFCVSTKVFMWDKTTYLAGKRTAIFEKGHITLKDDPGDTRVTDTFFATGGAAAFCKKKYEQLHGFDSLYYPLYWEDIDLCYRARKRGYKVLYDPNIVMYHKHQATITKMMNEDSIKYLTGRNSYLFLWRNVTSPQLIFQHIVWCPLFLMRDLLKFRTRFWISVVKALHYLPDVLLRRYYEKRIQRVKDEEIMCVR